MTNETTPSREQSETSPQTQAANLMSLPGRCFFKNAVVYHLPEDFEISMAELEEKLDSRALRDCGPLEKECNGWVSSSGLGRTVHALDGQFLIALGSHKKLLPASAVREELNRRIGALTEEQGFAATRKQKRELKETVKSELLAKAMVKTTVTRAWLDVDGRWLVVEASGAARAERVVNELREALGSFAATVLDADPEPSTTLGSWLKNAQAPEDFTLDTDLELRSQDEAVIRYSNHPLDGEDIKKHLDEGKSVTKIGLTWKDRLCFVLTNSLELKKIKFLELETEAEEDAEQGAGLSPEEQFDADLVLMTGELGQLLAELAKAIGVKREPGLKG